MAGNKWPSRWPAVKDGMKDPARDGELAARRDNAAAAESDGTLFGSVERLVDVAQFNADREWDHLAVLALIDAVRTLSAAVKKGEA